MPHGNTAGNPAETHSKTQLMHEICPCVIFQLLRVLPHALDTVLLCVISPNRLLLSLATANPAKWGCQVVQQVHHQNKLVKQTAAAAFAVNNGLYHQRKK